MVPVGDTSLASDLDWLEVSGPGDGSVPVGGSQRLRVEVDARGLGAGPDLHRDAVVTATDPGGPHLWIPVAVTVR